MLAATDPLVTTLVGISVSALLTGFISWVAYVSKQLRRHAEVLAVLEERLRSHGEDLGVLEHDVRVLVERVQRASLY